MDDSLPWLKHLYTWLMCDVYYMYKQMAFLTDMLDISKVSKVGDP